MAVIAAGKPAAASIIKESSMILIIGGAHQGKSAYAGEHYPEKQVFDRYHETVRKQMREGKDPIVCARELIRDVPDCVVISDEMGCGVIPLDAEERLWRELSGRVNCEFAAHAEEVIRMICGIGVKIK